MTAGDDAVTWAHGLEAVIGRIAPRFGRKEPRRRARAYLILPIRKEAFYQRAGCGANRLSAEPESGRFTSRTRSIV